MSVPEWVPNSGSALNWIKEQLDEGNTPRSILQRFVPALELPDELDDPTLWRLIADVLAEPERRQKLANYNTISDAVELLKCSRKILVLTGAGVSVSCGIPDFRSKNGIYARLHRDFPDLPDPQSMFDMEYFTNNPRPFFDFAAEIFPGQFQPSLSHMFIKMLEDQGKLLRNYTQNIDTLEQVAGIKKVVQCHGSFATATCLNCKHQVDSEFIKEDVLAKVSQRYCKMIECKRVPKCPVCPNDCQLAVLKPDIVFFGENLPKEFHDQMAIDKTEVDLLIVIGSSMKVRPVALVPACLPNDIPQILINREPLTHMNFDVELLGNCDNIINELCLRLGSPWDTLSSSLAPQLRSLQQIDQLPSTSKDENEKEKVDEEPEEEPSPKKIRRSDDEIKGANSSPSTSAAVVGAGEEETATKFKTNFNKMLSQDINGLRKMYKPRMQKLSALLPENTFLFIPPNRYVFEGAEVYKDLDQEESENDKSSPDSDSDDSSSSGSSSDDDRRDSSPSEERCDPDYADTNKNSNLEKNS